MDREVFERVVNELRNYNWNEAGMDFSIEAANLMTRYLFGTFPYMQDAFREMDDKPDFCTDVVGVAAYRRKLNPLEYLIGLPNTQRARYLMNKNGYQGAVVGKQKKYRKAIVYSQASQRWIITKSDLQEEARYWNERRESPKETFPKDGDPLLFKNNPPDTETFQQICFWYWKGLIEKPQGADHIRHIVPNVQKGRFPLAFYIYNRLYQDGYIENFIDLSQSDLEVLWKEIRNLLQIEAGIDNAENSLDNKNQELDSYSHKGQEIFMSWLRSDVPLFEELGAICQYNIEEFKKLLLFIGVSFLGSNFRSSFCTQRRRKNNTESLEARREERSALAPIVFLEITNGSPKAVRELVNFLINTFQMCSFLLTRDRYTELNNSMIGGYNWIFDSGLLKNEMSKLGTIIRSYNYAQLMPNQWTQFGIDCLYGASVNISPELSFANARQPAHTRDSVRSVITGRGFSITKDPLFDDGGEYQSDMLYAFVTDNVARAANNLNLTESDYDIISLGGSKWGKLFDKEVRRASDAWALVMLSMYYTVDFYMFGEDDTRKADEPEEELTEENNDQLLNFLTECCDVAKEEIQQIIDSRCMTAKPDIINTFQGAGNAADKGIQEEWGIKQLKHVTLWDLYGCYYLWCKVKNIEPVFKEPEDSILDKKFVFQLIEKAQVYGDFAKMFRNRISGSCEYAKKCQVLGYRKAWDAKEQRVIYGISIKSDVFKNMVKQYGDPEGSHVQKTSSDSQIKDFQEAFDMMLKSLKSKLESLQPISLC